MWYSYTNISLFSTRPRFTIRLCIWTLAEPTVNLCKHVVIIHVMNQHWRCYSNLFQRGDAMLVRSKVNQHECTVVPFSIEIQNESHKPAGSLQETSVGRWRAQHRGHMTQYGKKWLKKAFVLLLANQSAIFCACCIFFYATCQSINRKVYSSTVGCLFFFCLFVGLNRAETISRSK